MGHVHIQQLHFDPQIIKLNVKITRQNSVVCVVHKARPENLLALKKCDCLQQTLSFLQIHRNNLFFKKTVQQEGTVFNQTLRKPKSQMNLNYCIRKKLKTARTAVYMNWYWKYSANSPRIH